MKHHEYEVASTTGRTGELEFDRGYPVRLWVFKPGGRRVNDLQGPPNADNATLLHKGHDYHHDDLLPGIRLSLAGCRDDTYLDLLGEFEVEGPRKAVYCHNCGTELIPASQFCHLCGAPVEVA